MTQSRLRIGVCGLGRGFMLTLPALLHHPRVELTAAADPRPEARRRFAAEIGGRVYEDMADLCADTNVDAVYIATPHELHAPQAVLAARAGKHALVEKPMSVRLEDCRAMTEEAAHAGTFLIIGPSHAFDAPVRLATELIASGRFGRPRMITALNFTDYVYRPRRPEELGPEGGVVFGQAVHHIDVLRRLAAAEVQSICARTGDWDPRRPTTGAYAALMTFENGVAATMTYSGYGRYDSDELCGWVSETGMPRTPREGGAVRRTLSARGSEAESELKAARAYGAQGIDSAASPSFHEHFGFVLVSCEHADLRLTPEGVWVYEAENSRFHPVDRPTIPRREVVDELVGAVLDGRRPVHDGAWGTASIACCLALIESSTSGRPVVPER